MKKAIIFSVVLATATVAFAHDALPAETLDYAAEARLNAAWNALPAVVRASFRTQERAWIKYKATLSIHDQNIETRKRAEYFESMQPHNADGRHITSDMDAQATPAPVVPDQGSQQGVKSAVDQAVINRIMTERPNNQILNAREALKRGAPLNDLPHNVTLDAHYIGDFEPVPAPQVIQLHYIFTAVAQDDVTNTGDEQRIKDNNKMILAGQESGPSLHGGVCDGTWYSISALRQEAAERVNTYYRPVFPLPGPNVKVGDRAVIHPNPIGQLGPQWIEGELGQTVTSRNPAVVTFERKINDWTYVAVIEEGENAGVHIQVSLGLVARYLYP